MNPAVRRLLGVLLLLGLWAPSPSAAQAEGPTYFVQEGDTLIAIADRFGSSVDAIAGANGLSDPSRIFPGMELVIPGFPGVRGVLETRAVAFGENLESLHVRYGIPTEALIRLNRVIHPERVHAGEDWVVAVADEHGGGGEFRAARAGRGLIQESAAAGVNPWQEAAFLERPYRRWFVPGDSIAWPGGGTAALALPHPVLEIQLDPTPVVQGRTAVLRLLLSDAAEVEATWDGRPLSFHRTEGDNAVALQGIHAQAEPGLQDVELFIRTPDGSDLRYRQPVRVASGGYGSDPVLYVPPETLDPAFTGPEDAMIRSLVNQVTEERLWVGAFEAPSSGSYTSRFGSHRNYNNTGYLLYHTGLDFSGRSGAPIRAPARGRVVFAGLLQVRGNTTFIDHGWGVFSGFLHQSEMLVQVGQLVEAGETIGLVGDTGRATGAHLHWEVWINGVAVDPEEWLEGTFP